MLKIKTPPRRYSNMKVTLSMNCLIQLCTRLVLQSKVQMKWNARTNKSVSSFLLPLIYRSVQHSSWGLKSCHCPSLLEPSFSIIANNYPITIFHTAMIKLKQLHFKTSASFVKI